MGLPNDGSFLVPPSILWSSILILGIIGSIRNVLSIALGAPAFYSFDGDILWTLLLLSCAALPVTGALLDWQLRKLGYRHLAAESIFGLSFYLQGLHLIIPFVDAAGFALGIPPEYEIFANSIRSEWYTNVLHMSPGILFGWWVTAFVTARVLTKRLGISWPAMLLAGATTYTVILVPTYFVFPALNTLFNRAWGPYLWNPLEYLFIYPKWFPFWGYAWWFTLSAVPGLIYYVRNSSSEQTRNCFSMNTAGRAHVWLVCIAAARYYLDTVWSPGLEYSRGPLLSSTTSFTCTCCTSSFPPSWPSFSIKVFASPLDTGILLRESVLLWIVYPMVPIISMATRSAALSTIEWFRTFPLVHGGEQLPACWNDCGDTGSVALLYTAYLTQLRRRLAPILRCRPGCPPYHLCVVLSICGQSLLPCPRGVRPDLLQPGFIRCAFSSRSSQRPAASMRHLVGSGSCFRTWYGQLPSSASALWPPV